MIILDLCIEDWRAIFSLGGVCRTWRLSALETPRAWALVRLHHISPSEARDTIIERGRSIPLHLKIDSYYIPGRTQWGTLTKYESRVVCLRHKGKDFSALRYSLINISKLVISYGTWFTKNDLCLPFNGERFPCLRSLALRDLHTYESESMPWPKIFVSLQELEIDTSTPRLASGIISRVSNSLTHLYITFHKTRFKSLETPFDITFPRLRHLSIVDNIRQYTSYWPFQAHTPVLESYGEVSEWKRCIHKDTTTVTEAFIKRYMDVERLPQLRQLTTSDSGIQSLLAHFLTTPNAFPNLELLHCPPTEDLQAEIDALNAIYGREIALVPPKKYSSFESHPRFYLPLCADSMGCNDQ